MEYKWTDETDDYAEDIKALMLKSPPTGSAFGVRSRSISVAFNKRIRELRPALEHVGMASKVVKLIDGTTTRLWVLKDSQGPYTIRDLDEAGNWD